MRFPSTAPVTCARCDAQISQTRLLSTHAHWTKMKKEESISFGPCRIVASEDGRICYACYKRRLDEQREASEQPSTRSTIAPPPPRFYEHVKTENEEEPLFLRGKASMRPSRSVQTPSEQQARPHTEVLDCTTPDSTDIAEDSPGDSNKNKQCQEDSIVRSDLLMAQR